MKEIIFRHSTRKANTLRPAVQAQSSNFTLTITKNSIRSTGVKLASPPSPSARVSIYTRYGLSKFFPPLVRNILFFLHYHAFYK